MKTSADLLSPRVSRRPIGQQLLNLIGHTPLLSLSRLERETPGVKLLAKAEWCNPGGSVKDRAAASIITDAEARGLIRPGVTLLDATSGNTGVAYAMICAAKGYRLRLCIPKNANPQVLSILRAYETELSLTDPLQGSDGAIREARRLAQERPDRFVYLDQYNNPANWKAHYETTAMEIWEQTKHTVTHFIAGLGTTGTFTGTSRRLKELSPEIRAMAVQPDSAFHGLEGLKHLESAMVPGIYDPRLPDETVFISTEDAYQAVQRLTSEEGLLVGPSSGAALAAGLKLAQGLADTYAPAVLRHGSGRHPEQSRMGAVLVLVFPDSGHRYLAEGLLSSSNNRPLSS